MEKAEGEGTTENGATGPGCPNHCCMLTTVPDLPQALTCREISMFLALFCVLPACSEDLRAAGSEGWPPTQANLHLCVSVVNAENASKTGVFLESSKMFPKDIPLFYLQCWLWQNLKHTCTVVCRKNTCTLVFDGRQK